METLQRHIYDPPQMSIAELLIASVCAYVCHLILYLRPYSISEKNQ